MARPRRRWNEEKETPAPCVVRIPPPLAAFIYRERQRRNFTDETELVCHIIRQWAEGLDEMNWTEVLKKLKEESEEADAGST